MATNSQIEANRRNAQKSTGPRTEEGKSRSRFNAVTHGMTATFDAVPGEDADTLRRRIDDWTADLNPRNQVERDLIERAARASWQLDRVEQAHVDRLTANILKATSGENETVENEVFALGARLFPGLDEPHGFWPGVVNDPNHPALTCSPTGVVGPGLSLAAGPLGRAALDVGAGTGLAIARQAQGNPALGPASPRCTR